MITPSGRWSWSCHRSGDRHSSILHRCAAGPDRHQRRVSITAGRRPRAGRAPWGCGSRVEGRLVDWYAAGPRPLGLTVWPGVPIFSQIGPGVQDWGGNGVPRRSSDCRPLLTIRNPLMPQWSDERRQDTTPPQAISAALPRGSSEAATTDRTPEAQAIQWSPGTSLSSRRRKSETVGSRPAVRQGNPFVRSPRQGPRKAMRGCGENGRRAPLAQAWREKASLPCGSTGVVPVVAGAQQPHPAVSAQRQTRLRLEQTLTGGAGRENDHRSRPYRTPTTT